MAKTIKVGINGFGRIGRSLLRLGLDKLDIVAINNRSSIEMAAHLLKYDSVHGTYLKKIHIKNHTLQVDGKKIQYCSYAHPSEIPWDNWGVDLVLECSGKFKNKKDLTGHLKKGVKKVFIAAPSASADFSLIYGVNHKNYKPQKHKIISNSSCTTNCLAPIIHVLDQKFKITECMFTTVHSYTQDQNLLDASHKNDLRRARAAALSMIPTSTGATKALMHIFPSLKEKIKGTSIRVPTANVSLVDLVFKIKKTHITIQEIHNVFLSAQKKELKGILSCEKKELVSVDFNGNTHSCIIDLASTEITQTGMVKLLAWYDNETGFSQRMIDFINWFSYMVPDA